ncbi:MAG: ABC transporter substrate-binding protein [Chloroflexota bacterium]|nr:ABC transporter substrate-binding protein [Chloroflexota bacterium]
MKKYLVLTLVLTLAVIIAACAPAPTPVPTAAPPTAAPKQVEIQFWTAQSQTQDAALKKLADSFKQKYPNITVVVTYQGGYPDLFKKVTAAIAAGAPPDVAIAYPNQVAAYIKSDAVIALDDMMKDPKIGFTDADLKDIFPSFIDKYPQYSNKVYSLAFMRSMQLMAYNGDMLKSAGFDKAPETYDDFMKVCAALSKPDLPCYELPGSGDASGFASWVFSRGGDLLSPDFKTVLFDQKPGLDSMNFLNDLFVKKYAIIQAKAYQDQTDIAINKVVFGFTSSAGLPYYASAIKDAGKVQNWGIAPYPRTIKDPVVNVYGPSTTIFKTTPEKQQAAFLWIKYLMDKDPNAEWAKVAGYFPALASTKDALADYIKSNPMYGQAYGWLQYGRAEPQFTAAWEPIRNAIGDAMVAVANGKATPEQALKDAVKKANDAIAAAQ